MKTLPKDLSPVVQELQNQINADSTFAHLLNESLTIAQKAAQLNLSVDLYNALNQLYSTTGGASYGWPTNSADYTTYLTLFEQVLPSESVPYSPWSNSEGYSQEVYDRLCQFYWLVNQPLPDYNNNTLQTYTNTVSGFSFADWLDQYATEWGNFLNTTDSLTPITLASFIADPMYNAVDYLNDRPNWKSFNTFFYRQLNTNKADGSPMRPIANPGDNTIVCSPADCTFKAYYQIDGVGNVYYTDGAPAKVKLKQTHVIGNIKDLLGPEGSQYASDYYNGTFVHYFLSPFDYHRFHTPISGTVTYITPVTGSVYLDVNITGNQFDAPDSSEGGYEFTQARGIVIVDSGNEQIGSVATIPVGMAQVSSVHMYTQLQGQSVNKGTEFGYFAFGGSDIIMLFQQPYTQLKFITTVANAQDPSSYTNPAGFHFGYGQTSVIIGNS